MPDLTSRSSSRPLAPFRTKVLCLTGLSGAGKSSIAESAVERLCGSGIGIDVVHLHGDVLRAGLCSGLGFSPEDRLENVRRAAEVAKLMAAQGRPTVCSLISPLGSHRDLARRAIGGAFVEVYVRCELAECVRRDPKGLYARAIAGAIPHFTGIGAPYEPPTSSSTRRPRRSKPASTGSSPSSMS